MKTNKLLLFIISFLLFFASENYILADKSETWIQQLWQKMINDWQNTTKSTSVRLDNGLLKESFSWKWDTDQWVYSTKRTTQYEINKDIIINYSWSETKNVWEYQSRFTTTYNNDNQVIEDLYENWENSNWVGIMKNTIEYSGGKQKWEYDYYWEDNQWILSNKLEYKYKNDLLSESIEFIVFDGQDEKSSRDLYEYNTDGDLTNHINFMWDGESWIENSRELSYYQDGNLTSFIMQWWETNDWVNSFKEELVYLEDGKTDYYQTFNWEENVWVNSSKTIYGYEQNELIQTITSLWNGFIWEYNRKSFKDNSNYVTDNNINSLNELIIYPNPTTKILNLELKNITDNVIDIRIFDINGKLIELKRNISHQNKLSSISLNLENYNPGVYIVIIKTIHQELIQKFVVE